MRYFDHDTTASSDALIMHLRLTHGGAAVDAYYTIIEEIYSAEEPLNIGEKSVEMSAISHRLATDKRTLNEWLKTMINIGLLVKTTCSENDEIYVTSERAEETIRAYQEKCEKARQAGKKGGRISKRKATAKRPLSDRQANAKLREEKRGDITSSVISPMSGEAGAEKPAPPSMDSVPCPDNINPYKRGA